MTLIWAPFICYYSSPIVTDLTSQNVSENQVEGKSLICHHLIYLSECYASKALIFNSRDIDVHIKVKCLSLAFQSALVSHYNFSLASLTLFWTPGTCNFRSDLIIVIIHWAVHSSKLRIHKAVNPIKFTVHSYRVTCESGWQEIN